MKMHLVLLATISVLNLAACAAYETDDQAQAQYSDEKAEAQKAYDDCVKNANGDQVQLNQCQPLLQSVGAVENAR
jgi:protein involved in sex pheromone biosynthesis